MPGVAEWMLACLTATSVEVTLPITTLSVLLFAVVPIFRALWSATLRRWKRAALRPFTAWGNGKEQRFVLQGIAESFRIRWTERVV